VPVPALRLAGLLPWTFFSNALGSAGSSLVGSAHLITKVYFPRMIIPAAAVLAGPGRSADLPAGHGRIDGLVWRAVPSQIDWPLLPVLMLADGREYGARGRDVAGAPCNVRYRDIRYADSVPDPVLDVCDTGDLSGEPGAGAFPARSTSSIH
jgi:lipopolysaccharide transport system permease protein